MKRIILAVFMVLCVAQLASAQTGVRIFGAQQFVLDDNTFANPKVYLSQNVGSLGIDNSGVVSVGTFPSACALLDLRSTTKGFLPPRVSTAQEAAICGGTPTEGLMVYNTTTHTLDVYNGTLWGAIAPSWGLTGNTGTTPATNFLGTIDAQDFVVRTNNTERMRVLSNGNVNIGNNGFGLFNVNRTATGAFSNLGDFELAVQPTVASGDYRGIIANLQFNTANPTSFGISGFFSVQSANGSTGTISTVLGVIGNVGNYSTATIARAEAVTAQIQSQGTGGLMVDASNVRTISFASGTQNITNLRGLWVSNGFASGTVTNNYGIDIDQLSFGTSQIAFRYNHATQPVQINGNGDVRIGGLTPTTTTGLFTTRTATVNNGGAKVATESQMIASPTGASFLQYVGTYTHVDAANANAIIGGGGLYGLWGGAELFPTTTAPVFAARGVFGELFYQTNQTLNDGAALAGVVDIQAAGGTINLASGTRLSFNAPSAATITDLKMFNVLDFFANAGTITNTYGLYIGDITIGTQTNKAYSIYATDINTRSFVNGFAGFGTTQNIGAASDPKTAVDISGALSIRYDNSTYFCSANPTVTTSAFLNMDVGGNVQLGYITIGSFAPGGTISGFAPATNGRTLIIHKQGGATLTFNNEDAVNEPTAGNRIHCMSGANFTLPAGEAMITLIHEGDAPGGSLNRWVILNVNTIY